MESARVIVLTPIKNESWILDQFLRTTSRFADAIIIADQSSLDNAVEICSRYNKVTLIKNHNSDFDESGRQRMLIAAARSLFPNDKRILFGLDADEIISYEGTFSAEWKRIRNLDKGDSIFFEKPDVLPGIKECIRWETSYFPIGYVDDGIEHTAKEIHSRRIPISPSGKAVKVNSIKFMHFALSRPGVQSAKMRYYSVLENVKRTSTLRVRRKVYRCNFDYKKQYPGAIIERIPDQWIANWKLQGVDLEKLFEPQYSWHDFEVLRMFSVYGCRRFHYDDIWNYEWDKALREAHAKKLLGELTQVNYPGPWHKVVSLSIDVINYFLKKLR